MTGWSLELAPEAINGQAPDTGNMELLHLYGHREQKQQWLDPLMEGTVRSVAMTKKDVAISDATNIETCIIRDGDEYVSNGPQVVEQRRRRRAGDAVHRHGQNRPRRAAAPPAADGAGPT